MSRRVLVTGGTRGIGAAIAERFAAAGDEVVAVGRQECDVSDEAAVAALFERVAPVDVLVNNAGVASSAPLARTTLDDWRAQLDVNATGAFLCTRAALPGMLGLMRAVAAEVAGTGVTANAVCPAFVRTEMTGETIARITETTGRSEQEAEAALAAASPVGRLLEPDEVAFAVAFLAAPEAGAINGQTLILDGGGIQA